MCQMSLLNDNLWILQFMCGISNDWKLESFKNHIFSNWFWIYTALLHQPFRLSIWCPLLSWCIHPMDEVRCSIVVCCRQWITAWITSISCHRQFSLWSWKLVNSSFLEPSTNPTSNCLLVCHLVSVPCVTLLLAMNAGDLTTNWKATVPNYGTV